MFRRRGIGEVSRDDVQALNRALVRLERFWSDHVAKMLDFEAQYPERCLRIRYEDVDSHRAKQTQTVLAFRAEPADQQTLASRVSEQHPIGPSR
ncbi:hypothetical protein B4Q13_22560, partial [Lacticaseibacillus rhamnosus]